MRKLAFCLPAVLCLGVLIAQEAETVLKVDVNVVNILFSVRDKKGALDSEPAEGRLHGSRGRETADDQTLHS